MKTKTILKSISLVLISTFLLYSCADNDLETEVNTTNPETINPSLSQRQSELPGMPDTEVQSLLIVYENNISPIERTQIRATYAEYTNFITYFSCDTNSEIWVVAYRINPGGNEGDGDIDQDPALRFALINQTCPD